MMAVWRNYSEPSVTIFAAWLGDLSLKPQTCLGIANPLHTDALGYVVALTSRLSKSMQCVMGLANCTVDS